VHHQLNDLAVIPESVFTPKVLCIKAQDCEALRATLGKGTHKELPARIAAIPINENGGNRSGAAYFPCLTQGSFATVGFDT